MDTSTIDTTAFDQLSAFDKVQAAAALEHQLEVSARRRHLEELLGVYPAFAERLGQVIELGRDGDAVVEIHGRTETLWGVVVDGRRGHERQTSLEAALVYYVAVRLDGRTTRAHEYALRALTGPDQA